MQNKRGREIASEGWRHYENAKGPTSKKTPDLACYFARSSREKLVPCRDGRDRVLLSPGLPVMGETRQRYSQDDRQRESQGLRTRSP